VSVLDLPAGRHRIAGPGGSLEVLVDHPDPARSARGTAVLGHPHPLFGGTMDNKVVQTLARSFVLEGWTAVRFNFRGVGASEGTYDEGQGELQDYLAVVSQCAVHGPLAMGGFSFGAFVASHAIEVLHTRREITSAVLIGTAVSRFSVAEIPAVLRERSFVVHGEQDETVPLADVMQWARPQNLPVMVVPGGEHFFHGQLPLLRGLVQRHIRAFSS
jgi:alpha/beta superfamily hydrolase